MKIKSFLAKPYASIIHSKVRKGMATAVADQQTVLQNLIKTGGRTLFGKEHGLQNVKTYEDFKKAIPVRDYEALKPGNYGFI